MPDWRSSAAYRIAVTYAALLAWTILLLGTTIYYVADLELRRQHDREVVVEIDRLAALHGRSELLHELRWRQATASSNRFRYALIGRDGKEIADAFKAARVPIVLDKVALADGIDRVLSKRVGSLVFANGARLAVTRNPLVNERFMSLIFKIFAAACVAVLAVSVVAGVVLAWYLRNRLKPINMTANAIATGEINWRVSVRNPGDEFDTAGRAINLMLDRVASLMENLRQVSSDIAHDLRKPLMRLLVQTDRLGRVEGAEQRIYELGDEMLMLFSGILRIAEVEGGGLRHTFQRVDFSGLMNDVAESFAPALVDSEHTIEWTIAPDVAVMGNRELLAQLAANLLDNARVHTPPGTAIRLGVVAEEGVAKLWVEDDGPGVSAGDRVKLLQRFFRTETSRTTPGNGLGLSLVAAAANAHGGTVIVEDAAPGLRIIVTLPLAG